MSNPPDQPAVPPGEEPSEREHVVPPVPPAGPGGPAWTPPGGDSPQVPPIPPAPVPPSVPPGPHGAIPGHVPPMPGHVPPMPGQMPPGYPPRPAPPTPPRQLGGLRFGWGVLIGLVGGIVLQVVAISSVVTPASAISTVLFVVLIVGGIVLVSIGRTRSFGVGALTSIAATPLIVFGTCIVILSSF